MISLTWRPEIRDDVGHFDFFWMKYVKNVTDKAVSFDDVIADIRHRAFRIAPYTNSPPILWHLFLLDAVCHVEEQTSSFEKLKARKPAFDLATKWIHAHYATVTGAPEMRAESRKALADTGLSEMLQAILFEIDLTGDRFSAMLSELQYELSRKLNPKNIDDLQIPNRHISSIDERIWQVDHLRRAARAPEKFVRNKSRLWKKW